MMIRVRVRVRVTCRAIAGNDDWLGYHIIP